MRIVLISFLSVLIFLSGPYAATFAEWFDGEVSKVDAAAGTFTISEIDPITDIEEKEEILVSDATVFTGVASLKDIRQNDNVTVEAQYDDPTDVWKAVSVEVAGAGT